MTSATPAPAGQDPQRVPVLDVQGITKSYGRVQALSDGTLQLFTGEVVGLMGDNGAGKSTLIGCISGATRPDQGQIMLDGHPRTFREPLDAMQAGIQVVYQSLAVAPALDIATNVFLGREIRRQGILGRVFRMLDSPKMKQRAKDYVLDLGIETLQDTSQAVETLSGGQRQAVAVARAAAFGTKVVILDEPTAALGVRESGQVVQLIKRLHQRGLPVLLVAHDIPMMFEVSDRILIMRHGRVAADIDPARHSMEEAIAIMTGAKS